MVAELQRIRRRTGVRPLPVLALALVITAGVTYKFAMKPRRYTADVVLAMSEGALGKERDASIPFDQLKEYVANVLLPIGGRPDNPSLMNRPYVAAWLVFTAMVVAAAVIAVVRGRARDRL
jgi:hypothetical protein